MTDAPQMRGAESGQPQHLQRSDGAGVRGRKDTAPSAPLSSASRRTLSMPKWFSCRTAVYLASVQPAVMQDTG
jgi:hypothetical protein